MNLKTGKIRLSKKILCVILSLTIAFGVAFSIGISNITMLDWLNLKSVIFAYADEEVLPSFYRDGELVGIYNPDYSSTEDIYYKIGENGTWTEYEVPVAIPAYSTTAVYAKIGENGNVTGDTFSSSKLAVGEYIETVTDYSFTYNELQFDFTRTYSSSDDCWQMPFDYHIKQTNNNLLELKMSDGSKYVFIKNSANEYVNELNGYTISNQVINNETFFVLQLGELEYYFSNATSNIYSLRMIKNEYNDHFIFTLATSATTISDNTGRAYSISSGSDMLIVDGEDYEIADDFAELISSTDPNENVFEYLFISKNNELGNHDRIAKIIDQEGVTVSSYEYTNNRMTRSSDKTINYNADGRVSSIVYDSGEAVTYTYDDEDLSFTSTNSLGETTTTVYNDAFLPVSYTDEYGNTTEYTYDSHYRVLTETSDGVTVTYSYDNDGNIVSQVSSESDSEDNTYYTYDNDGRIIREQCGDSYTYYSYNSNNDIVISATLKSDYQGEIPANYDSSLTCFDTISYTYDSSGRVITVVDSLLNETTTYQYDLYGNTTRQTVSTVENGITTSEITDYTYDLNGNMLTYQCGNETSSYTYDDAGRILLSNESGKCTRTLYDSLGRVVQEIGPEDYSATDDGLPNANTYSNSNVGQRYVYNNNNQLVSEINRLNVTTSYTYHTNGQMETEAFDMYTYTYTNFGALESIQITGADDPYVEYTYNNSRQNTEICYGNGQTVYYAYDNDGNCISQSYRKDENSSVQLQFTYSYSNGELSAKYDYVNNLKTSYSSDGTVSVYRIDALLTEEDYPLLYSYKDTEAVYNNDGELTSAAYSTKSYADNTLRITYNNNSTDFMYNNTAVFSVEQSENESTNTYTRAITDANDDTVLSTSTTYDSDGNVTSMNVGSTAISYVYDSNGNITEYHQGNEAAYYTYDSKQQLIREDLNYTYYQKTNTYTYDNRGNVTSIKQYDYTRGELGELEATTTSQYEYEDEVWVDRIKCTSPDYYEYDEQGNLITLSQIVYFYWQNGRELEKVNLVGRDDFNVIDFKYDDEGIRTEKHTGTDVPRTYYTTEDGRITSQYIIDGLGQKSEEMIFLYDGDELVGAMHRGHQYYYLKNAMGDVIGVVNEDGQQIVSYAYNAWGKVVSKNVLVGGADVDYYFARNNPMLYRSYYYDDTLSMYYLQSRYYMPEICRFVNSDIPEIAQQSKDDVNGLNLFAYCNNNPVNNCDGLGLAPLIDNIITFSVKISAACADSRRYLYWRISIIRTSYAYLKKITGTIYCSSTSVLHPKYYIKQNISFTSRGSCYATGGSTTRYKVPAKGTRVRVGYSNLTIVLVGKTFYWGNGSSIVKLS